MLDQKRAHQGVYDAEVSTTRKSIHDGSPSLNLLRAVRHHEHGVTSPLIEDVFFQEGVLVNQFTSLPWLILLLLNISKYLDITN